MSNIRTCMCIRAPTSGCMGTPTPSGDQCKQCKSPSFTKAVMHVRFRKHENQGKWPQQRKPFPILCVMTLNQPVKETDAKRERLVGGRTTGGGFLQPCLSEFYHHPPFSFMFPPHIMSVCSLLLEKVSTASPHLGRP